MDREIKFRAWSTLGKGFINGFNMIGFSTGQGAPGKHLQRYSEIWREPDSYILMQYTGLKVKNEVEMYEGDIISVINPECQRQKKRLIGEVVFSYASFGFKLAKVDVWEHYSVEPPEIGEIYWFLNIADFALVEVIGNIHQHPELLKD